MLRRLSRLLAVALLVSPVLAQDPAPADPAPETTAAPAEPAADNKTKLFEQLDKDGDGAVQLSELSPELQKRLKPLFDRLKKTEITVDELSAAGSQGDAGEGTGRAGYFKTLDSNGDGQLTVAEVPEAAKGLVTALLDRMNKKPTEALTRAEYDRFTRPGGSDVEPMPEPTRVAAPGLLGVLDANGDGKLDPTELAKAGEKFAALDTDGSGDLDARELVGDSPMTDGTGEATRSEALTRRIFDELDVNDDNVIDMEEANAEGAERLAENFERIDGLEPDGKITFAEFKTAIGSTTPPAAATSDDADDAETPETPETP